MPAYAIGTLTVSDPSWVAEYGPKVAALIEKHGGRYTVRGNAKIERLEGSGATPDAIVVLEFPSMAQAKAWYHDPEYEPLIKLRQSGSTLDFFLVEGA